jgi:hypothetical protein
MIACMRVWQSLEFLLPKNLGFIRYQSLHPNSHRSPCLFLNLFPLPAPGYNEIVLLRVYKARTIGQDQLLWRKKLLTTDILGVFSQDFLCLDWMTFKRMSVLLLYSKCLRFIFNSHIKSRIAVRGLDSIFVEGWKVSAYKIFLTAWYSLT